VIGVLSLLLAAAMGAVWMEVLLKRRDWALNLSLGVGLGCGAAACLFLLLKIIGMGAAPLAVCEVLLMGAGIWTIRRYPPARVAKPPMDWMLLGGWVLLLMLAALALSVFFDANPHGEWDAWNIWNLRAKYLAGPGDSWKYAMSDLLGHKHPDYPLLWSSLIAQGWAFGGPESPAVPVAAAVLFLLAVAGLLVSGLSALRGRRIAFLAGFALLTNLAYVSQAANQYADVPLSYFVLASLTLAALEQPLLAGVFASLGAGVKNEGLAFLAVLAVCLAVANWRQAVRLLAGAAPVTAGLLLFKALAPKSDLLVHQEVGQIAGKLLHLEVYGQVAQHLVKEIAGAGPLYAHPLLALAVAGTILRFGVAPAERRTARTLWLAAGLLFAAYFVTLVVTPYELNWQLNTTAGRLLAHLWPGFLLAFFYSLRALPDTGQGPQVAGPASVRRTAKRKKFR
jgi:hypothetical protein